MFPRKIYLCAAVSTWVLVGVAPAIAQSDASVAAPVPRTNPAPAAAPLPAAAEIVVTATRREQALQDVPIAVTAVGNDALAKANITSTVGLTRLVPNLNISSQVGAMVVYLRGVGQLSTNAGQEPAVATYVDGVYQPTVFSSLTSLSNVSRVEVIKGPQGTLFGRNATGGLINIVTKDPSHIASGTLDLSYGNYQDMRASGYYTRGFGEKVAADFAFSLNDQTKAVGINEATGSRLPGTHNIDLRSKILIEPTETTRIRIGGVYSHNQGYVGNNLAILPGSVAFDGTTAPRNFYNINTNIVPSNKNSTIQGTLRIDQELKPFDVVSITAYTRTKDRETEDDDGTPVPLINTILSQRDTFFTQELQLASKKGSPLTWILGAFYYRGNGRGYPTGTGLYGLGFGGGGLNSRGNQLTNSYAVFGEGTYEILPKLELTVGGRYTIDRKTLTGDLQTTTLNGTVLSTTPIPTAKKTFKEPTYRAILSYHVTSSIMAYGSYSRGFKSGGFDTGFPTGVPYKPETIDAFEAGLKTELFDRRLTLNTAGFYYNYKNLQLPILVDVAGVPSQITENATSSKVYGVDLDGYLKVTHDFNLNFGFGYLHSKYSDFKDAPCTRRTPAGATEQYVCDVSGNTTTHAPKITYNVGGTYTIPTNAGDFFVTGNYTYMSQFYYSPDDRLAQKGYGLLNGQIGWKVKSSGLTIDLFAENLLNKKYTVAQFAQDGLDDSYVAGEPRKYGVEARFRF